MLRLEGRVALSPGRARAGTRHAVRLAAEGADIIGVDRAPLAVKYAAATPADLQETADLVAAEGRKMTAVQGDVRHLDELQDAVARGLADFGRLDIVVANAGILTAGLLWEITEEQWQQMIDINLTGVWHTLKATVPTLIDQGQGGSIIIVSSVAGLRGIPFAGHYVAAKHGAVGLCRTLANEVGPTASGSTPFTRPRSPRS